MRGGGDVGGSRHNQERVALTTQPGDLEESLTELLSHWQRRESHWKLVGS